MALKNLFKHFFSISYYSSFLLYRWNLSQLTIDMWIESSLLQGGSRIEDDIPLRRKAELVIGLHLHTQHWNRLPRLRSQLEEL